LYPDNADKISDQGYLYEKWNTSIDSIVEIVESGLFNTTPVSSAVLTGDLSPAVNVGDRFAHRMRAYITVETSGDYYFYVSADDGAMVWLSSDNNPTNKKLIITLEKWTSHKQFKRYPEQKSAKVSLTAGQTYFIEVSGFEHEGGDNLSLGWSQVSNNQESAIEVVPARLIQYFYLPPGKSEDEIFGDFDNDSIPNSLDMDDDNDGVVDDKDAFPLNPDESVDTDADGLGNNKDNDDDNDGVIDNDDSHPLDASLGGSSETDLNRSVIQAKCIACHVSDGAAKSTDLVFRLGNTIPEIIHNETQLSYFITETTEGGQALLDKSRGLNKHGGGSVLLLGSVEYSLLEDFVGLFTNDSNDNMSSDGSYRLESPAQTYRRASLYLTGKIPARSKILEMQTADEAKVRSEVQALMTGEGFHNFLKNEANARLHSRHLKHGDQGAQYLNKYYVGDKNNARKDLAEEPLELIAYIVENDRPYTEVLTADYTMVGEHTDELYNTGVTATATQWKPAKNRGHEAKTESTFNNDADGSARIENYPHAGVLSSWAYLSRYPTTATNRNRARAAWTMRHFLGFDIEKSAARVLDLEDVSDELNPTMNNPACMACHTTLDPVAGAFKNFHERIGYKAYGSDSLDETYRKGNPGVDWYHDMLVPGFRGEVPAVSADSLQWLAKRFTEDYRFAIGTVKFWWPAIYGQEVLGNDATRSQLDTQELLINRLANDFRQHLNLKQLLADMIMSDAFRVDTKASDALTDDMVSLAYGARHLLTGDELTRKTASLTGFTWNNNSPKLTNEFYSLYGGTDDVNVDDRPEDLTSSMFRVAQRHAYELGCAIVRKDFDRSSGSRFLFNAVERDTTDEIKIRQQLAVLNERLLNRLVTINSAEVNEQYAMFLELRQARMLRTGTRLHESNRCDWSQGGSDNDQHYVLGPWKNILIYMMTDTDYLYE